MLSMPPSPPLILFETDVGFPGVVISLPTSVEELNLCICNMIHTETRYDHCYSYEQ